jgi:hypothetical protein
MLGKILFDDFEISGQELIVIAQGNRWSIALIDAIGIDYDQSQRQMMTGTANLNVRFASAGGRFEIYLADVSDFQAFAAKMLRRSAEARRSFSARQARLLQL